MGIIRNPRKIVFTSIGIIFFILVIIFAYGRFGRYINGPVVLEISLQDFQSIENNYLVVSGMVSNVQNMSINGRVLDLDKDQHFSESLVVPPGMSTVDIVLFDAFGKQRSYSYTIYSSNKDHNLPRSYSEAQLLQEPTKETLPLEAEDTVEVTGEPESLTIPNQ